jgi:hypothetical protein
MKNTTKLTLGTIVALAFAVQPAIADEKVPEQRVTTETPKIDATRPKIDVGQIVTQRPPGKTCQKPRPGETCIRPRPKYFQIVQAVRDRAVAIERVIKGKRMVPTKLVNDRLRKLFESIRDLHDQTCTQRLMMGTRTACAGGED